MTFYEQNGSSETEVIQGLTGESVSISGCHSRLKHGDQTVRL